MFHQRLPAPRKLIAPLTRWSKESAAIYLAVAFFPTMIAVGAVVDYSRANNYKTAVQVALDAAVLSGGRDSRTDWTEIALNTFNAKLSSKYDPRPNPTFVLDPSTGNYIGTVTGSRPTSVLGIINIGSINVTVTAAAVADHDNAFILNLDHISPKPHVWSVSKLAGDAFLTNSAGQQTTLSEGAVLSAGNNISTGQNGRVLLVRGQETILIASNSIMGIPTDVTQGMSTTIHQWAGSILFALEKRNYKHFEVITPYLTAVVKGTQFRVTVNKDDTSVEVLRGQVEVTDFRTGQYALVLPEQAAKVLAQGSAGLSLSGSGTLNPIQQGTPRKSSVNPIALSSERFSTRVDTPNGGQVRLAPPKAENDWVPPSSERDPTKENSRSSGLNALSWYGQSDNAIFSIAFAGALGAFIGAFAHWLSRRRNQRSK